MGLFVLIMQDNCKGKCVNKFSATGSIRGQGVQGVESL